MIDDRDVENDAAYEVDTFILKLILKNVVSKRHRAVNLLQNYWRSSKAITISPTVLQQFYFQVKQITSIVICVPLGLFKNFNE